MRTLTSRQKSYLADVNNRWKMWFFLFGKLPSMIFWQGRVEEVTADHSIVSLPCNWRTQNPFSSIYFAAQSGIGELATGLLVTTAIKAHDRKVAMYVVDFRAQFTKKATERIYYRNDQGAEIQAVVDRCIETNEAQQIDCIAIGKTAAGQEVGRVKVTWSLKAK